MLRHNDTDSTANSETAPPPGRGPLSAVVDTIRELLSDPPHEPGQMPVGPGALGLEWK